MSGSGTWCVVACLCASAAHATGDNYSRAEARFVCGSPDRLVFLVETDWNSDGTRRHNLDWEWRVVDVASGRIERVAFAKSGWARDPEAQQADRARFSIEPGSVQQTFQRSDCRLEPVPRRSRPPLTRSWELFSVTKQGAMLGLTAGQQPLAVRVVPLAWSGLARGDEETMACASRPANEVAAGRQRTVFALECDVVGGLFTEVQFAAVENRVLQETRAALYEQAGLALHQAGDFAGALELFLGAGTPSACWGAARAYSRLGRPADAVSMLKRAGGRGAKLEARIAAEHDFDPIRASPELKALVAGPGTGK